MDPLSEIISLLRPQSLISGGFGIDGSLALCFPKHQGIKCYAVLAGECWLAVEGVPEPVFLTTGSCYVLPRGLPFTLATDLSVVPTDFLTFKEAWIAGTVRPPAASPDQIAPGGCFIAGGHFALTGVPAGILLKELPPIVHVRGESDKAAMLWSLERMKQELNSPQPGGSLIAQQLASMMLVQALRLHLAEAGHATEAGGGTGAGTGARSAGWLSALADKQMSTAIQHLHADPGHCWTLQGLAACVGMSRSIFALRFKQTVGSTPMEYLTRWRMLLAGDRIKHSPDSISTIASSLGYDSESAFGKAFRRTMGCSPRQYGKAMRG